MILAHGLGGGADLPIPASFAIAGGCAALVLSFAVLLLAWRKPRLTESPSGVPLPRLTGIVDSAAFRRSCRVLGLAAFAFAAWASVAGPDLVINPFFGFVYVWLWVGLLPASILFGPVVKALSPARTIHALISRLTGSSPDSGIASYPAWLGYWPAALGLFAFVWMELVYPRSTYLGPLRLWFVLYLAIMVVGSAVFGSRWMARADPFEVYSSLAARLSPWGRRDGLLVLRRPLVNLAQTPGRPGLVAVVAVLLGSTGFDSFRESNFWLRYTQTSSVDKVVLNSAVLTLACVLVGGVFVLATAGAGGQREGLARSSLPRSLAHAIVPIIVGYMVAHYLTFFVEVGKQTLILASDPLAKGWNLFGTADWEVQFWLSSHPTLLASIKVLAIVTGHVLGVIASHDRCLELLRKRRLATGQIPLLLAMVAYTFTGLYLLFGL